LRVTTGYETSLVLERSIFIQFLFKDEFTADSVLTVNTGTFSKIKFDFGPRAFVFESFDLAVNSSNPKISFGIIGIDSFAVRFGLRFTAKNDAFNGGESTESVGVAETTRGFNIIVPDGSDKSVKVGSVLERFSLRKDIRVLM
jgi:hypothetical protein